MLWKYDDRAHENILADKESIKRQLACLQECLNIIMAN